MLANDGGLAAAAENEHLDVRMHTVGNKGETCGQLTAREVVGLLEILDAVGRVRHHDPIDLDLAA